jgi:hypothetical protein
LIVRVAAKDIIPDNEHSPVLEPECAPTLIVRDTAAFWYRPRLVSLGKSAIAFVSKTSVPVTRSPGVIPRGKEDTMADAV